MWRVPHAATALIKADCNSTQNIIHKNAHKISIKWRSNKTELLHLAPQSKWQANQIYDWPRDRPTPRRRLPLLPEHSTRQVRLPRDSGRRPGAFHKGVHISIRCKCGAGGGTGVSEFCVHLIIELVPIRQCEQHTHAYTHPHTHTRAHLSEQALEVERDFRQAASAICVSQSTATTKPTTTATTARATRNGLWPKLQAAATRTVGYFSPNQTEGHRTLSMGTTTARRSQYLFCAFVILNK